ncbi:MAG: hypothetical protein MZW92_14160 [Comamonadaceae bacterium]|nr:hypothetical protein [Comamonadaceae bacterium]
MAPSPTASDACSRPPTPPPDQDPMLDAAVRGRALMLQGTASDVGKSLLVAGLCRAYARRVFLAGCAPFKAAEHERTTPRSRADRDPPPRAEGGPAARRDRPRAGAAGAAPPAAWRRRSTTNPVLLKPQVGWSARRSRCAGARWGTGRQRHYHELKPPLMPAVMDSYRPGGGRGRPGDRRGRRRRRPRSHLRRCGHRQHAAWPVDGRPAGGSVRPTTTAAARMAAVVGSRDAAHARTSARASVGYVVNKSPRRLRALRAGLRA